MSNVKSLTREIQNFNIEINWKKSDKYQKIIIYTRPQWRKVAKNDQAAKNLANKTAEYFTKNLMNINEGGVKKLSWMFIQKEYNGKQGFWEGLDKDLFKTDILKDINKFDCPFVDKNISNVHTALIQIFFGNTRLLDELGFSKS